MASATPDPEATDRAIRAVRQAMHLAADGHERAAIAHDDLAQVQDEAAKLEAANGSPTRAGDRHRAAKIATNEARADRAEAEQFRLRAPSE